MRITEGIIVLFGLMLLVGTLGFAAGRHSVIGDIAAEKYSERLAQEAWEGAEYLRGGHGSNR